MTATKETFGPARFYSITTCPTCNGHGDITDRINSTTGYQRCPTCYGTGTVFPRIHNEQSKL